MASRPELFDFQVTAPRQAEFPMSMLRFSESWPADDSSAHDIHVNQANHGVVGMRQRIRLRTIHAPDSFMFEEAAKRWSSFGWAATPKED